jgi:hypothetical protein
MACAGSVPVLRFVGGQPQQWQRTEYRHVPAVRESDVDAALHCASLRFDSASARPTVPS